MQGKYLDTNWEKQVLRAADLRATRSRISTLAVLRAASKPLSHLEVFDRLPSREFDKVTIFRNLKDLVKRNILRRLELGDHRWRFELIASECHEKTTEHPLFICNDCNTLTCLREMNITDWPGLDAEFSNRISDVIVRGICQECSHNI